MISFLIPKNGLKRTFDENLVKRFDVNQFANGWHLASKVIIGMKMIFKQMLNEYSAKVRFPVLFCLQIKMLPHYLLPECKQLLTVFTKLYRL